MSALANSFTVYDSVTDQLVLYDGSRAQTRPAGETGSEWTSRGSIPEPPSFRLDAGVAMDARRHRLLVCGGRVLYPHNGDYTVSDMWALSLDPDHAWTRIGSLPDTLPSGSAGQAVFCDPV